MTSCCADDFYNKFTPDLRFQNFLQFFTKITLSILPTLLCCMPVDGCFTENKYIEQFYLFHQLFFASVARYKKC